MPADFSLLGSLYWLELIALGLVSIALIVLTISMLRNNRLGVHSRKRIQTLRSNMEADAIQANQALHKAHDWELKAKQLAERLELRLSHLEERHDTAIERMEMFEERSNKFADTEKKLHHKVNELAEHMEEIKGEWQSQLEHALLSVRSIQGALDKTLLRVENTLKRLGEQEVIAQSIHQKIADVYSAADVQATGVRHLTLHSANQPHGGNVSTVFGEALDVSSDLLEQLKSMKLKSEQVFSRFSEEMGYYESQAYQHFDVLFNESDHARKELLANLEESRKHLDLLRNQSNKVQQESHNYTNKSIKKPFSNQLNAAPKVLYSSQLFND